MWLLHSLSVCASMAHLIQNEGKTTVNDNNAVDQELINWLIENDYGIVFNGDGAAVVGIGTRTT